MTGNNIYATKEPGEPDHAGNPGGKSVWWTWQAPGAGFVTISTRGSTSSAYPGSPLDTVLGVYVGAPVSSLTEVSSNDEDPATYYTSRVGFRTTAGTVYRIAVDGYTYDTPADADCGTIVLTVTYSALATNDDFCNAARLIGTNLTVNGNNDAASKEPGEPDHGWNAGGKSVWWCWPAPTTGFVTLSTAGSTSSSNPGFGLDALLGVYLGNSVSNLTEVASDWNTPASVTFRADSGSVYWIAVDGASYGTSGDADSGDITLSLRFTPGLPTAPAWGPLPDIYWNMVSSTDFSGKVVVLNFWTTWCPPCVSEIPDLVALYQNYSPDGLVVVGVSLDNSPDGVNPPLALVSSFVSSHSMTYPVLMSRPSWTAIQSAFGGIPWIPATFVIDRQNRIYEQFVGSQSYSTFERTVVPLLYPDLRLELAVTAGTARISWPITHATFSVQSTANLQSGVWVPVTATVQSDGSNYFVELPAAATSRFFRLVLQ